MKLEPESGARRLLAKRACACIAVCGLFPSIAAEAAKPNSNAAFPLIQYRLPATAVTATLTLTLTRCSGGLSASSDFMLAGEAGADGHIFAVTPADLESVWAKRKLQIKLHDTGTISSINSKVTDRTAVIIGNVVKTVLSIAAVIPKDGPPIGADADGSPPPVAAPLPCRADVSAAVNRVGVIDGRVLQLLGNLPTDPLQYRRSGDMLDRLLAERAALTTGLLQVKLEKVIEAGTLNGATVSGTASFKLAPALKKWTGAERADELSISWKATSMQGIPLAANSPAEACAAALAGRPKPRVICFAEAASADFEARLPDVSAPIMISGAKPAQAKLVMPQWGTLRTLDLSSHFGADREVAMTLDKFGQASEMTWNSEARAEAIAGAAADVAGQVQTFAAANTQVARDKAEIEALTTQQTLNRLRACKAVLEKGGSKCPAEAEDKTSTPQQ